MRVMELNASIGERQVGRASIPADLTGFIPHDWQEGGGMHHAQGPLSRAYAAAEAFEGAAKFGSDEMLKHRATELLAVKQRGTTSPYTSALAELAEEVLG